MQTLSKEREEALVEGVKRAVDLVDNQGLTPDAAIEKVARSNKWGEGMIRFASHAYNTGRQTAQRETNTSILDKFAEFPLADPAKVIEAIYPSSVKSAADLQQETGVSSDYIAPPAWLGRRRKVASMEKAAAADDLLARQPRPEPYQPDPRVKMAKTHSQYVELQKEAEEARHQAAVAHESLIGSMGRLAEYFKKQARDRYPFHVVEHAVQTYYPESAGTLMDFAYKRSRLKEARAKDTKLPHVAIDHDAAPFNLIKECIDQGGRVVRLREHHKEAQDAVARFKEGELAPFVAAPPASPEEVKTASSRYLIDEEPAPAKEAGFMSSVAGSSVADRTKSILDRAMSDAPVQEANYATLEELSDPSHEAELRKIRAQSLLSEMMDDEVIGGYRPEQVLQAYNEISQLSPRGAMQPLIARSLLRRHLQGNMEPFEAKEITDIEKGVGATEGPNLLGQPANALV